MSIAKETVKTTSPFVRLTMSKSNIRGPYTITELSQLTGLDVEMLRHYQQIGVIPIERAWNKSTPQEVFYKVDVDRIRAAERKVKLNVEETKQNGHVKTELTRRINRAINVHAREYPQLSRSDLLDVLHRAYVKHLNGYSNTA
tara:strand:+ start:872 stop:1300 length:429 start_codon:yes stop_codon:yes gene_type:complete